MFKPRWAFSLLPHIHFSLSLSPSTPGTSNMSMLQLPCEGCSPDKVLPRLLLRVREDTLRHTPEEVPQVQRCFRSQRLPSHLHRLELRLVTNTGWEEEVNDISGGTDTARSQTWIRLAFPPPVCSGYCQCARRLVTAASNWWCSELNALIHFFNTDWFQILPFNTHYFTVCFQILVRRETTFCEFASHTRFCRVCVSCVCVYVCTCECVFVFENRQLHKPVYKEKDQYSQRTAFLPMKWTFCIILVCMYRLSLLFLFFYYLKTASSCSKLSWNLHNLLILCNCCSASY